MSVPVYNKLVRDHVPAAIAANGKSFRTRRLSEAEYAQALKTKLREEADEYARARDDSEALEELADMLEVIRALSAVHGAAGVDPAPKGRSPGRLRGTPFFAGCG